MSGYENPYAPACTDNYSSPGCSETMPHQDTVLLIWVFSIFGLVLVLMIGSFYACHLYAQRLERLNPMPAAQAQQDIESQLVPMKQAFFIEQPDGKSDVAWAITTAPDAEPLVNSAPGNVKKPAAFPQLSGSPSAAAPLSAGFPQSAGTLQLPDAIQSSSRTQLLPGSTSSCLPLSQ